MEHEPTGEILERYMELNSKFEKEPVFWKKIVYVSDMVNIQMEKLYSKVLSVSCDLNRLIKQGDRTYEGYSVSGYLDINTKRLSISRDNGELAYCLWEETDFKRLSLIRADELNMESLEKQVYTDLSKEKVFSSNSLSNIFKNHKVCNFMYSLLEKTQTYALFDLIELNASDFQMFIDISLQPI